MNTWTDADGLLLESTAAQLRKAGSLVQATIIERAAAELTRLRAANGEAPELPAMKKLVAFDSAGNSVGTAEGYTAAQMHQYAQDYLAAALPHILGEPVADPDGQCHWVNQKPTSPGVYGVRGYQYGVSKKDQFEAVVMVKFDGDELVCNMHEHNTNENVEDWGLVSDISDKFEWCKFVPATKEPTP